MKLNKANNGDSISVILPKKLISTLGWKIGQECILIPTEQNNTIIIKNMEVKNEQPSNSTVNI